LSFVFYDKDFIHVASSPVSPDEFIKL
jgi:hypothetical protein